MKFFIQDSFSKCGQIRRNLRIWQNLLKESFMENFIFCAVLNFNVLGSQEEICADQISKSWQKNVWTKPRFSCRFLNTGAAD